MDAPKKLSPPKFAKLIGVSQSAVSRAINTGRLPNSAKMLPSGHYEIDVEVGQVEWVQNKMRGARNVPERGDLEGSAIESERKKKHYDAELARLKFEKEAGKLLDASKVEKESFKVARVVRDAILAIPARMSAELAGMTNPFEIEALLEKEFRTALENLSATFENEEVEEVDEE